MSKKVGWLLFAGIFLAAASTIPAIANRSSELTAQSPLSPVVIVPDGTPVRLSLEEALNSSTSQTGESIHFRVLVRGRASRQLGSDPQRVAGGWPYRQRRAQKDAGAWWKARVHH